MKWIVYFILLFSTTGLKAQPSTSTDDIGALAFGDSTRKLIISSVTISGNKKTRDYIIQREMLFKKGDSIIAGDIYRLLEESRRLVYNTTLFTSVVIEPASIVTGDSIDIAVRVKEKWYLYPTPQFLIVDRNLNEWIKTYNADLDRVIYGVRFAHYNFSGRRDQVRVFVLNGYSRNLSFTYYSPYSNRSLTEGFSISAGYTENREVNYKTSRNNGILQFNNGAFSRRVANLSGTYIKRKGYYRSHIFGIAYTYSHVDDSIITTKYNPDYFSSVNPRQHIPDISYTNNFIKVDNVVYPLDGITRSFGITKRGFGWEDGINALTLDAQMNKYISHGKNWYSSIQFAGKMKLPFDVAYINRRAFGFGEFYLRGLEYYVIDGVASTLGKYTLKKQVANFTIKTPTKLKKIVPEVPFRIFLKTYADAGYSYIPKKYNTTLNNRFLYTGGFGIDILTLYDINLKLEFSFNQLKQNGLFLHSKGGF